MPQTMPPDSPISIRTLSNVIPCSICGTPLRGNQTVCSAKCRIIRSRQRQEQKRWERDAKIRLCLHDALKLLAEDNYS
jgi:predicted nucleic acid-binding Zn ribbon protein